MQHHLPVIYQDKRFAIEGGLISYGAELADMWRHGGPTYVDRILRGAKPSDLPVQFPTKFTLVVNLKTAKAMSLNLPESFLLRRRGDRIADRACRFTEPRNSAGCG